MAKKPLLARDALTLDHAVESPFLLVLGRRAILCYQVRFGCLLHLPYVVLAVGAVWTEPTHPVWRAPGVTDDLEHWRRRVFALRAGMLAFVREIVASAVSEVSKPHWRAWSAISRWSPLSTN